MHPVLQGCSNAQQGLLNQGPLVAHAWAIAGNVNKGIPYASILYVLISPSGAVIGCETALLAGALLLDECI